MEGKTIQSIEDYVFGDVTVDIPMTIAPTGDHRTGDNGKEKVVKDMLVRVNMKGMTLKEAISKTLSQLSIDYKRTRRLKDSNGVFESLESWLEWYENTEGEELFHYSHVGKAPQPPKSDQELVQEGEVAFDQMSPEAQQEYIRKLQERQQR